jgi:hypothetical protein
MSSKNLAIDLPKPIHEMIVKEYGPRKFMKLPQDKKAVIIRLVNSFVQDVEEIINSPDKV